MSWYVGELPPYLPVCRRMRQGKFSMHYKVELYSFQAIWRDFGVGMRDWIIEAKEKGRKIAAHWFVPGTKVERIFTQQRDLWHKSWRQGAEHLEFSVLPEFDIWYDSPILEARKLQYKVLQLSEDMHNANMRLIWLLLDTKAGGIDDINWYSNYANKRNMRWVATNLTGARDSSTFREMLQVLAKYHSRLDPKIGILVNGPSSENRIRVIYRLFEGREVSICNVAKIEYRRRGIS